VRQTGNQFQVCTPLSLDKHEKDEQTTREGVTHHDRELHQMMYRGLRGKHRSIKKSLAVRMNVHIPNTTRATPRPPARRTSQTAAISAEGHDNKTVRRRAASTRHDGERYQRHWCHNVARRHSHKRDTHHRKAKRFGETDQKEESV
jgi:hypothetical protein